MVYVVALHGSAGSGKSTLCRVIGQYLGSDCLVIEEKLDEILSIPSSNDDQIGWYRRRTVISASDNVTHILLDHIHLFPLIIFTLIVYILMGTVWPVVLLFVMILIIGRVCRWLNSHILSKLWLYNIDLFCNHEGKSSCQWIWRDRTCLDIYTYCLMNKAKSVPLNINSFLLQQSESTSVAILLDIPEKLIEKHLRLRINTPTTSFSVALATRLLLLAKFPIRSSIAALILIERFYQKMNVPVIRMSEILDKLDHDIITGEIHWTKNSINTLIKTLEEIIQHRGPTANTIDDSLMPWKIVQNSRLYQI